MLRKQFRNHGDSNRIVDTEKTPRTNDNVRGNLLHNYKQKFVCLPDHPQLIKLCSNVGITKTVANGQYFTTLDDAELDKLGGSCREYTSLRDNSIQSETMDPWNTKICPVLEVTVSYHQDRYGIEIESFFVDGTCWVMIANRTNKYVTEMTEETQDDHIDHIGDSTGKLVAKARPKQHH